MVVKSSNQAEQYPEDDEGDAGYYGMITKVALMEQEIATMKECQGELKNELKAINIKLDVMRENGDKKPSWAVTFILTGLSSVVVALVVFVTTHIG